MQIFGKFGLTDPGATVSMLIYCAKKVAHGFGLNKLFRNIFCENHITKLFKFLKHFI